jgi:hypothetical protein
MSTDTNTDLDEDDMHTSLFVRPSLPLHSSALCVELWNMGDISCKYFLLRQCSYVIYMYLILVETGQFASIVLPKIF